MRPFIADVGDQLREAREAGELATTDDVGTLSDAPEVSDAR